MDAERGEGVTFFKLIRIFENEFWLVDRASEKVVREMKIVGQFPSVIFSVQ